MSSRLFGPAGSSSPLPPPTHTHTTPFSHIHSQGTGFQTLGVSLDYQDPAHFDKGDSGPAVLCVFGAPKAKEYVAFPELGKAVPFANGQALYFLGEKLLHATTNIKGGEGWDGFGGGVRRVGIGTQSSSRVMNASLKKVGLYGFGFFSFLLLLFLHSFALAQTRILLSVYTGLWRASQIFPTPR